LAEKPLDLAMPATNNIEQNQSWGEVRITDPGADLKVTKVDVVPLEIEAAANQSLQKVSWFSTVNGTEETPHELPPPKEPRYAVYQPTLYLDELHLTDWDVMTYYAKATTEKGNRSLAPALSPAEEEREASFFTPKWPARWKTNPSVRRSTAWPRPRSRSTAPASCWRTMS